MNDEQFLKLMKYVKETRQEVSDIRQDMATKTDIDQLRNGLDGHMGRHDTLKIFCKL